jgi:molecular chaperone GrpE
METVMTSEENPSQTDNPVDVGEETPDQALAAAETRVAQLTDQLLRSQAEAENVRKRAQRDVENAHKYALEKFAGELLAVVDNLERSVEAAKEQPTTEGAAPAPAALIEGVELSLKLFLDTLKRSGVHQINPMGEPFNPQFHEAVSTIESPHTEPGTVVTVLQKGYTLNGRLLRAAMVIVAKAPADAAKP